MKTTRRDFLAQAATAVGALALAPLAPSFAKAHKPKVGASPKVEWPPDEPPRFKVIHVHGGVPWKYAKHRYATRWLDKAIYMAGPGDMIFVDRGIHFLDGGLVVPPGKDGLRICGNETAGFNHRIHLNGQIVIRSNDVTVSCLHFKCGNYGDGDGVIGEGPRGVIEHCFFDGSPHRTLERVGTYDLEADKTKTFSLVAMPVEWDEIKQGDLYRVREPDGTIVTIEGCTTRIALKNGRRYSRYSTWAIEGRPFRGATT
jgi:hypothetical protein